MQRLRLQHSTIQAYTLRLKNISDVIDCNLKKDYQLLVIVGINI